ncbi:MAG: DUF5908 family protein [Bacteroidota bacterium]
MPIEVKEIHIKVAVEENNTASGNSSASSGSGESKEEIVTACVEQVLQILKDKEER